MRMIQKIIVLFLLSFTLISCENNLTKEVTESNTLLDSLAIDVVKETQRSWAAYKKYAWGHDVLKPISKSYVDWYSQPLYISPIDAYSTLYLMGLTNEAREIENYVVDSLDFDKDIKAKIFEVNIRILGGLLSMYELSGNEKVLDKAVDFADRMLPAFDTKTGIPKYWVNLKTGMASGDTVNVAEAASYTFEMGILSYYTKDPRYYNAGKKATIAIYERRSEIGLIGDIIDVETGEWVSTQSHICAGVDSYYEYLFKSYKLFGDDELGEIWQNSIDKVNNYLPEMYDGNLWYGRVDMNTGEHVSSVITLYDAFFPAILSLSGDTSRAIDVQKSWNWLWNKYGLEPMVYDYKTGNPNYPVYDLNPEIIESAYYLYNITGDSKYLEMNTNYWESIKKYCSTDIAFASVENVETMKQKDYMPTFFFAETLKYFYLTFYQKNDYPFEDYLFNTEAHPFKRDNFKDDETLRVMGINISK